MLVYININIGSYCYMRAARGRRAGGASLRSSRMARATAISVIINVSIYHVIAIAKVSVLLLMRRVHVWRASVARHALRAREHTPHISY